MSELSLELRRNLLAAGNAHVSPKKLAQVRAYFLKESSWAQKNERRMAKFLRSISPSERLVAFACAKSKLRVLLLEYLMEPVCMLETWKAYVKAVHSLMLRPVDTNGIFDRVLIDV